MDMQAERDRMRAERDALRTRLENGEAVFNELRRNLNAAVNDPKRSTLAGHAVAARMQAVQFLKNGGNEVKKTNIEDISGFDIVAWLADAGQMGKAVFAVEFLSELTELTISGQPNTDLSDEARRMALARACFPVKAPAYFMALSACIHRSRGHARYPHAPTAQMRARAAPAPFDIPRRRGRVASSKSLWGSCTSFRCGQTHPKCMCDLPAGGTNARFS